MNRGSVPYPCGSFGKFINSLMESGGEGADGNVRANELDGRRKRVGEVEKKEEKKGLKCG